MRATFDDALATEQFQLRARQVSEAFYAFQISKGSIARLLRADPTTNNTLEIAKFPLPVPLRRGQDYEIELCIVGT